MKRVKAIVEDGLCRSCGSGRQECSTTVAKEDAVSVEDRIQYVKNGKKV